MVLWEVAIISEKMIKRINSRCKFQHKGYTLCTVCQFWHYFGCIPYSEVVGKIDEKYMEEIFYWRCYPMSTKKEEEELSKKYIFIEPLRFWKIFQRKFPNGYFDTFKQEIQKDELLSQMHDSFQGFVDENYVWLALMLSITVREQITGSEIWRGMALPNDWWEDNIGWEKLLKDMDESSCEGLAQDDVLVFRKLES